MTKVEQTKAGVTTVIDTEAAVIAAIMENNEARFRLTEDTPLMQPDFIADLDYTGCTEAAGRILDGTYVCPHGTDEYTRTFVEALRRVRQPGQGLQTSITKEDFQRYWKKARERTSSSFSGTHFGHWIAATEDDFLSEVHALSTDLAYSTGFALPRWQSGLSAMLEKEKGNMRVDKLRAILLMEADFNMANKLMFGHRMMRHAERTGQVPDECFGSRNGHDAQELGVTRRVLADLSRQRRWPMAVASVDAQTCYDRIVHSVASICCQRWEVDPQVITTMLVTIQRMKFHLRMGYGDSDAYYGISPGKQANTVGN